MSVEICYMCIAEKEDAGENVSRYIASQELCGFHSRKRDEPGNSVDKKFTATLNRYFEEESDF